MFLDSYQLVVYGENPWAICAAVAAKKVAPSINVALIVDRPDLMSKDMVTGGFSTSKRLGGIYSVGGELTWDDYGVAGGTYRGDIYAKTGKRYKPDELADLLEDLMRRYAIDLYWGYHISDLAIERAEDGRRTISRIEFRPIRYGTSHYYAWDPGRPNVTLSADFFIDASVDGRLARAAAPESFTAGRYDWPKERLTNSEMKGGYMQSASVELLLGNFDTKGKRSGEWMKPILRKGDMIFKYNLDLYSRSSGRLFSGTADWTALDETTIWATGPHVFNVDTRAFEKDRGTDWFPRDMPADAWTYDQGYATLRSEIESGMWVRTLAEGLDMLELELLAVSSTMYVREALHCVRDPAVKAHGTENSNYTVTTRDAILAGRSIASGEDSRHKDRRIGIAHYGIDMHAFIFQDLYNAKTNTFFWQSIEQRMRPDLSSLRKDWREPSYGVLMPYETITCDAVANLLLCGYNVGASSVAWGEIRETPNLCTLGDACGATVGLLYSEPIFGADVPGLSENAAFISHLQEALVEAIGANIDTKRLKYPEVQEAA